MSTQQAAAAPAPAVWQRGKHQVFKRDQHQSLLILLPIAMLITVLLDVDPSTLQADCTWYYGAHPLQKTNKTAGAPNETADTMQYPVPWRWQQLLLMNKTNESNMQDSNTKTRFCIHAWKLTEMFRRASDAMRCDPIHACRLKTEFIHRGIKSP